MNPVLNRDFLELIACFNKEDVEYLLVGGYSVILHGYHRTTGDLDIWVNPTEINYSRIVGAFDCFQMPVFDMTLHNFLNTEHMDVFRFGKPPVAIDLITVVKGLQFDSAYKNREIHRLGDIDVAVLSLNDLKVAKKATNRSRDRDDLEHL